MTMKIEGIDQLNRTLLALSPAYERAATLAVNRTAQNIRNDAVRSIQRSSAAGVTYQKYNPRRTHTASAPGSPPNTDTGRLAGSITVLESGGPSAAVEAQTEYAAYLEFGTRNADGSQKMAARPFMTPAVEAQRQKYQTAIADAFDRAVKGVRK